MRSCLLAVFVVHSTTAGSVGRLCVGNAALNAPPSRSWALSSRCGCAMPALTPSEKRSKYRPPLKCHHAFNAAQPCLKNAVMVCLWCSRTPLATFHEGKHNIAHMDMDPSRGLMVTCGSDRIVKVNNSALIPDDSCMGWLCFEQRAFESTLKLKTSASQILGGFFLRFRIGNSSD